MPHEEPQLQLYRFRLPMRPLRLAGRDYRQREGLLACDASGVHWGEASPLPGFSRESLDDVMADWRAGPPHKTPSLRFCVDTIARKLAGVEATGSDTATFVPINALLAGPSTDILRACDDLAGSACQAAKLKVGAGSLASDIALVRDVRARLRSDQELRLDANRAWSLEDAITFARALADVAVAYIEEPTSQPRDLERFWHATGMPYALDETLRELVSPSDFPSAAALIVKPTLTGGWADVLRWRAWQRPLVFSGAFESGIGTLAVARMAASMSPGIPAGLDAYSFLEADLLPTRLRLEEGKLWFPESIVPRREFLTAIS